MKLRTSQINVELDSKTSKILNKRIDYLQRNRVMLLNIIYLSIPKIFVIPFCFNCSICCVILENAKTAPRGLRGA